jgi:hypothetical protein
VFIASDAAVFYRLQPWREMAPVAGYFSAKGGNQTPVARGKHAARGQETMAAWEAAGPDSRLPVTINIESPLEREIGKR